MSEVGPQSLAGLYEDGIDWDVPEVIGEKHQATPELFDATGLIDADLKPKQKARLLMQTRSEIHDYRRALTQEQLEAQNIYSRGDRAAYLKKHKIDWEYSIPDPSNAASRAHYRKVLDVFGQHDSASNGGVSRGYYGETSRERVNLLMIGLARAVSIRNSLMQDPAVVEEFKSLQAQRFDTLHRASMHRAIKRRQGMQDRRVKQIQVRAQADGRELSVAENDEIKLINALMQKMETEAADLIRDDEVNVELQRRSLLQRANELRSGLLVTDNMRRVVERTLPSLKAGKPLFLIGETGGAKTALARYISRTYFGGFVEIDGNPEYTIYNAIGKTGLRQSGDGTATESYFEPGQLYIAMQKGIPCIINEIDVVPTQFNTGLNGILQLRPGDKYTPPGTNATVVIKKGFCVIATANIKSERYDREPLDPSTMQRFHGGAGVEMIKYPDADKPPGEKPLLENTTIAAAALVNDHGDVLLPVGLGRPSSVASQKFNQLVCAAHVTQRLFADPTTAAAKKEFVPDAQLQARAAKQGEPVLKKAVIAPRELISFLDRMSTSQGAITIERILANYIETQSEPTDREILSIVLASHGLLDGITEAELRIQPGTLAGFTKPKKN